MNNFFTNESPEKVMGLLAVSLCSLAFLFAVTASNASFSGTEVRLPDPFNPANVVSMLDYTSNGYARFVATFLTQPAQHDYAYFVNSAQQDFAWVIDNGDQSIADLAGLGDLTVQPMSPVVHYAGHVAGASTVHVVP